MKCPICFHEHKAEEMEEVKITLGSGRLFDGPVCIWCFMGDFEYDPC